jgi:RNA polymerase sigma-70 factor (ECF subfamily)
MQVERQENSSMNEPDRVELIPTRRSLLSRLKDWNDQQSWRVFFDTYWSLIYHVALKAGLTEAEAQDVVQETIIAVSKQMPTFEYDAAKGSFKGWLLRLTQWRIADQFRKRQPGIERRESGASTATRTATIERVPDPAGPALEAVWNQEWEGNLVRAALARVKRKVKAKQYQIFDFAVLKGWPISEVAQTLGVSSGMVYVTKHRISRLMRKEIDTLRTRLI